MAYKIPKIQKPCKSCKVSYVEEEKKSSSNSFEGVDAFIKYNK